MAHVKLAMLLKETGYKSDKNVRFNVFHKFTGGI